MPNQYTFPYFPDYMKWAYFTDPPWLCCEDGETPCLVGTYFDGSEDLPDEICLHDLVTGKYRVDVPDYLEQALARSIQATFSDLAADEVQLRCSAAVAALSKTPPVPWIQSNAWPVCHGDFCQYTGEWNQEELTKHAPDGNGLAYLMTILVNLDTSPIANPAGLWDEIASGWTTIFVFQCFTCGKRLAQEQSF